MVVYTSVLQFYLKMCKSEKRDDTFLRKKKTEEKQNTATVVMSANGIETVLSAKLKLQGKLFE